LTQAERDVAGSGIEPAAADERGALWKRLAGENVAMLVTHDASGMPIARPVQPVRVEDGRLWIFTAADGDIARDVGGGTEVHVVYANQQRELFVSLNASARLVRDAQKARELWSPLAGAWYPAGSDDANLALVRIDVHRGDYWDMKDARLVRFFKLASAAVTGVQPDDVATHRRFEQ
jgi:general stress protein 26